MKSWKPTFPISSGATAYHDAVAQTSWHYDNVAGLIELTQPWFKPKDIIVDFGAGTGASAVLLLNKMPAGVKLWLVDNSPSWLGKAYDLLCMDKRTAFGLLEKTKGGYATLDKVFGKEAIDHVISANTVHLIPPVETVFKGVAEALKSGGTFTFQSGNISRKDRPKDLLMIDDTIQAIHELSVKIVNNNHKYSKYRDALPDKMLKEKQQREFIFPIPRTLGFYREALIQAGFKQITVTVKPIKVKFSDWLNFVRVRRLQAGILPEIGGVEPTESEATDRDTIITQAAQELFAKLLHHNQKTDKEGFTAEWVYFRANKD